MADLLSLAGQDLAQLLQGVLKVDDAGGVVGRVDDDGLGIFRPYAKSVPGGAASVEEASQMGANNLVDGIRIRFIPESEDNLGSELPK